MRKIILLGLGLGTLFLLPAAAQAQLFTVDTTVDYSVALADGVCDQGPSATCGLREAVTEANANPGMDGIELTPMNYTLSLAGAGEDANQMGDLDILDEVSISGAGSMIMTDDDRVLDIHADNLQLDNLTLADADADYGGCLRIYSATLFASSVTMRNCSADYGGAVYAYSNASLDLWGIYFDANTAQYDGGAIMAEDNVRIDFNIEASVQDNRATNGGGIELVSSQLVSGDQVAYLRNTATEQGGAIRARANSSVDPRNAEFRENEANEGGAAFISDSSFSSSSGLFKSNHANNSGGAIKVESTNSVLLNLTQFEDNSATNHGGAIFTQEGITLSNNEFISNKALTGDAGALYIESPLGLPMILSANEYRTNQALTGMGGAIYASEETTIYDDKFYENRANYGGAIAVSNISLTVEGQSYFERNISNDHGGAIYLGFQAIGELNGTYESNYADFGDGGAVYAEEGTTTSILGGATFNNNVSFVYGGAIRSKGFLTIGESYYNSNRAFDSGGAVYNDAFDTTSVDGARFSKNDALKGGGLYISNGDLIISNSSIEENIASDGAGLYQEGGTTDLNTSLIKANRASMNGGGMFISLSQDIDLQNNTFDLNNALSSGGAASLEHTNGQSLIKNNTFTENKAEAGNGGALHFDAINNNVSLEANQFNLNTAPHRYGGSVACLCESALDFISTGNTYTGGAAQNGGGLAIVKNIYSSVQLSSQHDEFIDNRAVDYGGGLYATVGQVNVTDFTNFKTNTSGLLGAGVYLISENEVNMEDVEITGNEVEHGSGAGAWIIAPNGGVLNYVIAQHNTALNSGGGLYLQSDTNSEAFKLFQSSINNNKAASGAGLHAHGKLSINQSSVYDNFSDSGASGLYLQTTQSQIVNSTIANSGGSADVELDEGSILILYSSTLTSQSDVALMVRPSTIATNTVFAAGNIINSAQIACSGDVTSLGGNVFSDSSCNHGPDDLANTDPQLEAAAFYNNFIIYPLSPTSPARDFVQPDQCNPSIDQIDQSRPLGAACDAGALEMEAVDINSDMSLSLEIDKTDILVDEEALITARINNQGPYASDAEVKINLPTEVELVSLPANCTDIPPITCLVSVPTGDEITIEIIIKGLGLGTDLEVSGVLTPENNDPTTDDLEANLFMNVIREDADLDLTPGSDPSGNVSELIPGDLQLVNNGPGDGVDVHIEITSSDPNLIFAQTTTPACDIPTPDKLVCDFASLPSGSESIQYDLMASVGGDYSLTTSLSSLSTDPTPVDDIEIPVHVYLADLNINSSANPSTITEGESSVLQFFVTNNGTDSATNAILTITIHPMLTITDPPAGCSVNSQEIICSIGNIPPAQQVDVGVQGPYAGNYLNSASVISETYEESPGDENTEIELIVEGEEVEPPPPSNIIEPTVIGSTQKGEELTCQIGSWLDSESYTYQWLQDGIIIPGAVGETYTTTAANVGKMISCLVTATGPGGTTSAESEAVGPISEEVIPPPIVTNPGGVIPPSRCTIIGTPKPDILYGTPGDDIICALAGNDKVYAGTGNDIIDAGPDHDLAFGQNGNDIIYGVSGRDRLYGGRGRDVVYGMNHNDQIWGGPGNDHLFGQHGSDKILGEGGRDHIWGAKGNDRLNGGPGADLIRGGAGHDRILGGAHSDKIYGDYGRDYLRGDRGNDQIHGGAQKDQLYGNAGHDMLNAGDGPDVLKPGSGRDRLHGVWGADWLYPNKGDRYDPGTGTDFINGIVAEPIGGFGYLFYCAYDGCPPPIGGDS